MNKRLGKLSLPVAGFLAGIVLAPAAAVAASASFSSSTGTAAVSATNTTAAGPAITAVAKGSGNQAAVLARNYASAAGANAFYSKSYVNTGEHYGIWGVDASPDGAGVKGESTNADGLGVLGMGGSSNNGAGVLGYSQNGSGVVGSGIFGVVSDGEIAGLYHLLDASGSTATGEAGDMAGVVQIASGANTATLTYPEQFPSGITPIVVVTPTSDVSAAGFYYVTPVVDSASGSTTGFVLHTQNNVTAAATFDYMVTGFVEPSSATQPMASSTAKMATRLRTQSHVRR
jgi:hypothetical protein